MPLHIVRQDITKMHCDAIVNAANSSLLGGGGVDGAIHRAAGAGLLEECRTLGGCDCGDAKITGGYDLPAKYVIHTVGPVWEGGKRGEKRLLESCYEKSLALAVEHGCESVAFPLISSGAFGYPKAKALSVAVGVISEFLFTHELTVYLAVFDKSAFTISARLLGEVEEFIDDNYVDESEDGCERRRRIKAARAEFFDDESFSLHACEIDGCYEMPRCVPEPDELSLADMISHMDDNFAVTLLRLIDAKGMTDLECYKKANVSKQTWYKIMNEKDYRPSKTTVISFAIALRLTLEEAIRLLATVGFTLSRSSKFDIIIEYFLLKGEYDVFVINETLFKFDQVCLGV